MAILFALIALVGWGAGDIFITKATRKIGEGLTTFWWLIICFLISLVYLPFAPAVNDWGMIGVILLLSFFQIMAVVWYIKALENGNASLVGTIAGSFSLIVVILSMILYGETLQIPQIAGIIFISVGFVLSSLKKEALFELRSGKVFSDPGVGLAIIVFLI